MGNSEFLTGQKLKNQGNCLPMESLAKIRVPIAQTFEEWHVKNKIKNFMFTDQ